MPPKKPSVLEGASLIFLARSPSVDPSWNIVMPVTRPLPWPFERLHRSSIVNTQKIEKYRTELGSRHLTQLANGQEVPVSRTRFKELNDRMV